MNNIGKGFPGKRTVDVGKEMLGMCGHMQTWNWATSDINKTSGLPRWAQAIVSPPGILKVKLTRVAVA